MLGGSGARVFYIAWAVFFERVYHETVAPQPTRGFDKSASEPALQRLAIYSIGTPIAMPSGGKVEAQK